MPPRFFIETALVADSSIQAPESVARHIQVLRLRLGETVEIFNGDGQIWTAQILEIGKRHVSLLPQISRASDTETPYAVTLVQGLAGGDKMDWLLEKCVELGLNTFQPIQTQRAVVRLNEERAARRQAHWQSIAIAACEQCGRAKLPKVAPVLSYAEYLSQAEEGLKVMLSPRATQSFPEFLRAQTSPYAPLTVLIGPEGGLSEEEEHAAMRAGFIPVSLGQRILRTETAGLTALAVIHTVWGEF